MQTFKITPILFALAGLYCAIPQTAHAQALTSRINNMCLSADGSVPTIGKPVIMWGCQNVTSQKVDLANQKTNYPVAKIAGLCLSSQATTRGSVVALAQCNNLDQQRFLMGADGFVRQFNFCLAITNGSAAQGAGLILWDCVNHPSQLWNYSGGAAAAPPPAPVPTPAPAPVQQPINQTVSSLNGVPIFLLNGRGAKCLNIYRENRGFNQTITIADCGARGHEQFVFMNNGELRDWGGTSGCVDVRWTDKYVVNRNCGSPTAQSPSWKLNNRGEIRTVVQGRENGWCLDIQQGAQGGISWIAGQGTQAVVASCNGSLTQNWKAGMLFRGNELASFGKMNPGTMGQHAEIGVRGGSLMVSGGGNVVAAGAGHVVAASGGNVVAAGAGNVMPAQISGVRTAGGQVVAAGAGNVVAAGAGNVVAAGAGNVIAAGASNLVAAGAGN